MKLLVLFCLVCYVALASAAEEEKKECEVCVKMTDEIKAVYQQNKKKNLAAAESVVEKFCGKKKKNPKDNKLCYNMLPLKKDVARQVSFNKDSLKICRFLSKKNPDFCTIKYPIKLEKNANYAKMRVKKIKQILSDRGVDCRGCIEKNDFVKRAKETEHMEL